MSFGLNELMDALWELIKTVLKMTQQLCGYVYNQDSRITIVVYI